MRRTYDNVTSHGKETKHTKGHSEEHNHEDKYDEMLKREGRTKGPLIGGCTLLQVADADSTTCGGANASVERSDGNRSDKLRNMGSMARDGSEGGKCLFRLKSRIETTNLQQQERSVDTNNSHSSGHARL
eukprot:GHVS01048010.1.p2 GENE.GHVS01048010.1~~GHVS01048010.1.p2  ORF type:complete len:130 (+),score=10.86 GHVS01048010.1:190-579(+)